jgi:serine/threonine protein kinase
VNEERGSTRARPGVRLGGRYRLERVIGTGGMASVWLGHDEQLDRPVAVKLLSDTLAEDERYVERFSQEARMAAGVSHPNLVNVYDFEARGRRPYLVMEYVEGPTLAELIEGDGSRIEPERVARELLAALRHIHDAGIVHRDVKPQNVLVGADGRTRLADFGIARPDEASGLTTTGQVLGTLQYLAPELRVGEPATVRSDLYAAGILLRECLPPGESAGLAALAERMSDPDPEARPSSAAVALSEIDATGVMTARPARATEPTPVELPSEPGRPETAEQPAVPEPEAVEETTVMRTTPPPVGTEGTVPDELPDELIPPPPPPRMIRAPRIRITPKRILVAAVFLLGAMVALGAAVEHDDGRPALQPLADKQDVKKAERREERPLIVIR